MEELHAWLATNTDGQEVVLTPEQRQQDDEFALICGSCGVLTTPPRLEIDTLTTAVPNLHLLTAHGQAVAEDRTAKAQALLQPSGTNTSSGSTAYVAAPRGVQTPGNSTFETTNVDDSFEVVVDKDLAKFMTDVDNIPMTMESNQLMVMHFFEDGTRRMVVERDTDLLTADDRRTYAKELDAARLDELLRWTGFKAMHRRSRVGSQNRIDITWVDKWVIKEGKRTIKSRMCGKQIEMLLKAQWSALTQSTNFV